MPEENPQYEKLLQYALRLIAAKRYTVFEMRKKLIKRTSGKPPSALSTAPLSSHRIGNTVPTPTPCLLAYDSFPEVPKVIARLKELKYLDDKKYIENYVADRIEFKPRGKFLIKRELKLKGIKEKAIEECLRDLAPDEEEIALSTLQRRERLWKPYPLQKQKEKAFRFLASKGFEPDAIYKAVKRCYHRGIE